MITVTNVTKCYDEVTALENVSFQVGRGEIVGLLGHNGAGKTTLMKIITGFLEPSAGTVAVGGRDVLEDRVGVQQQIGYMPENAPLYLDMLVQEYLLTMAELRGIAPSIRVDAVLEAVQATGLEKWLLRPIGTLSKGYRQRVGLAGAILHKPEVLILDEPTNGLDPVQIVEIRHLIRKLAENSTVILSTHILPEIEAVCDRVIILIDGDLSKDAGLDELQATDRVVLTLETGAAEASEKLQAIDNITAVTHEGRDTRMDGFDRYVLTFSGTTPPIPEIVRVAGDHNWSVGSVATDTPSLEHVFQRLMHEQAEKLTQSTEEVGA